MGNTSGVLTEKEITEIIDNTIFIDFKKSFYDPYKDVKQIEKMKENYEKQIEKTK
jgi:hypothetical protein